MDLRNKENPNFAGEIFDHPFAVSRGHGGYRKVDFEEDDESKSFGGRKARKEYEEKFNEEQ